MTQTETGRTTTFAYLNPIIDADWPDPDCTRVDDDYYLVASSFNRAPGLPVLHSRDLVNWTRVSYALAAVPPTSHYSLPRHGSGVWAPSIRHHDGVFHIVYPDPDHGIFVVSATDPAGPWSEPRLLVAGLGLIDPCPLWDDNGTAYLVHGWARSRSGRKNILTVLPVTPTLDAVSGPGRDVIDGNALDGYTTLEGPKFYKRDGWYWIFAPAGGVATGWQSVFRSRSPFGPYEDRIVLEQGASSVNGPHQGAWVDSSDAGDWFLHFQDRGVFGRVVHLQPMSWSDDGWPRIGVAGNPVDEHPSPFGVAQHAQTLALSDDFTGGIGPQWYWQANPDAAWSSTSAAGLTLHGPANDAGNLRSLGQVLGQQLPGRASVFTVPLAFDGPVGSRGGVVVLGLDYLWAGIRQSAEGQLLEVGVRGADDLTEAIAVSESAAGVRSVRLVIDDDAFVAVEVLRESWTRVFDGFQATQGQWIGAELGLFAAAPIGATQRAELTALSVDLEVAS